MVLSLYEANRTATRGFLPVSTPAVWRVKGHLQWRRKEQKDAEEVHSPTMKLIVTLADTVATEPRSYHPATGSNTGQTGEGDCLGKAGQDAPGRKSLLDFAHIKSRGGRGLSRLDDVPSPAASSRWLVSPDLDAGNFLGDLTG